VENRPPYAIASVDAALHLAQLLQQEGSLSVSEAAELLGVARSTAHRLFAMLVYRDFAEQGPDRRYRPGAVLGRAPAAPALLLRRSALPHLQRLVARVEETVSLQVRVGTDVRFVESVECERALRVGDRSGKVMPAHRVAGGKALLALLPDAALVALYAGTDVDLGRLRKQLALVRTRGHAVNDRETEDDVTAVGVPVLGEDGQPVAALSLAVPSARYRRSQVDAYVHPLLETAELVGRAARRGLRPDDG
jgi:IclR family transcriptional regulator, acetate operon repressor